MVSEYGNQLKIVGTFAERNSLIEKGWHEEKQEIVSKKENVKPKSAKPKEEKASGKGKTVRTRRNI